MWAGKEANRNEKQLRGEEWAEGRLPAAFCACFSPVLAYLYLTCYLEISKLALNMHVWILKVIMECHLLVFLAKVLSKLVCSALRDFRYWSVPEAERSPWKLSQLFLQLSMYHPWESVCPWLCSVIWHSRKEDEGGLHMYVFICHQWAVTHLRLLNNSICFVLFKCL